MTKKACWLLVGAVVTTTTVMAQKSNTPKSSGAAAKVAAVTPPAAPVKKERTGDINLESNDAVWDNGRNVGQLSGNVKITQDGEDFILYADRVTYYKTTNQADARGNLRVETKDSTIVSAQIHADFDAKIITLTGNVTMRSHGKEDGIKEKKPEKKAGEEGRNLREEVLHKPSRMTCEKIEYNYENREALVTGNIRLTQEQNLGVCAKILFDEEKNVARLEGSVIFKQKDGRTIETPSLTVWIDQDKILAPKETKIKIPVEKKEGTTPRPPKTDLGPPPSISDEDLKSLNVPSASEKKSENNDSTSRPADQDKGGEKNA
ncbi:MAG: LPS export ABC transporter periplasmic protein LptC [Armatimonadota bacterium]|nr:LPS export ABC transporter periplasmic protein LptC [Armatimonadota bacterium]